MQNAALRKMNLNWCYLAFPCERNELKNILKGLYAINCKGLNITIPYKLDVASLCEELSPIARKVGAVNTLKRNKEGGWSGTNTDVEGFISPLKESNFNWNNNKAIIIGCGGSARAVVAGLEELKFSEATIISRNTEKLYKFLKDCDETIGSVNLKTKPMKFKGRLETDEHLITDIKNADLIINTTPIGMDNRTKENTNEMPISKEIWKTIEKETTLYDLIYTPRPTPWLKWGAKENLNCIDGLEMLVQQGASSLQIWSERNDVPITIMRKAAKSHLKI